MVILFQAGLVHALYNSIYQVGTENKKINLTGDHTFMPIKQGGY